MNMKAFTTTAFCCEGKKKMTTSGTKCFQLQWIGVTVKLNSIKWKTGFMTAEMSEREKSQHKNIEYGKAIIPKQFFFNKRSNVHAVCEEVLELAYY